MTRHLRGRVARTIVLWVSFPLAGLLVFLALGPVGSPGPALVAGAVVGLLTGLSEAWALGRDPWRWAVLSAVGLGIGTAAATWLAAATGPGLLATVLAAIVAGAIGSSAQALGEPPLRPLAWVAVRTAVWTLAWCVSLMLAINADQGFVVFGATGALVFAVITSLISRWGKAEA